MKINIVGDNIQIEESWYKTVPEADEHESCIGCAFESDGNRICNSIQRDDFGDRTDLFCGGHGIIYKLTDIIKGKKKLLIL